MADIVEDESRCSVDRSDCVPHATNMHIQKLKVRPKKSAHSEPVALFQRYPNYPTAATVSLCTPELTTMLGCWAAKNDLTTTGACAESAKALYDCMRTTVWVVHQFFPVSDHIFWVAADGWQTAQTNDQLPPRKVEQSIKIIILGKWTKPWMTMIDIGTKSAMQHNSSLEYKFTTCRLSHGPPATDVVPSSLILRTT